MNKIRCLLNTVVNIWNSLHSYVTAETVNYFKSRLDNFWKKNEDIIQSDIHKTGNRSEIVVR